MSPRASTDTPAVAAPPGTPPAPPVSKGRLWVGVATAPAAWALCELVGYVIVSRSCEPGRDGIGSYAVFQPGIVLTSIAISMTIVAVAALLVAMGSWRALREREAPDDRAVRASSGAELPDSAPPAADPSWTRARFMAFAGIFTSAICGLGILFWSVPSFLLNSCSQVR